MLQRFAVPFAALVLGAGSGAGIAIAATSSSDASGLVAPDAPMPVPVFADPDAPNYDCAAYQQWGQDVYIPWWNKQMAAGVTLGPAQAGEIPLPPTDICGKS